MAHTIGARGFTPSRRALALPTSEPNVIPFIDVLLVLLIIFMVTAPMPTVDIQADLPQAGRFTPQPLRPTIIVVREEAGSMQLYVDEENVSYATLADRVLAHVAANDPTMPTQDLYAQARVYVRADQNTAYGNVVGVMSALKEAHFAQVGIFAEMAEENE